MSSISCEVRNRRDCKTVPTLRSPFSCIARTISMVGCVTRWSSMSSRTKMSCSAAFLSRRSMFAYAFSSSINNPKAVGLILRLASNLLSTIASRTRSYSSMKNCASCRLEISSPRTSMVKQAPSELSLRITATALSISLPATYRRAILAMRKRGMRFVTPTMNFPNTPIAHTPVIDDRRGRSLTIA